MKGTSIYPTMAASSEARWWLKSGRFRWSADDVQLVLAQLRQQVLGQEEGIQKGGSKGNAVPLGTRPGQSRCQTPRCGRPAGGSSTKARKARRASSWLGAPTSMSSVMPVSWTMFGGQLPLGVHKGLEPLLHLPLLQDHRADLGDHILGPAQARGLQVKADDGPVQVLVLGAPDGEAVVHVVDIVSLGAAAGPSACPCRRSRHRGRTGPHHGR